MELIKKQMNGTSEIISRVNNESQPSKSLKIVINILKVGLMLVR